MSAIGVLIMAYGTPRSPEGIGPYYTRIRHGRPPTDELLADLTRRYSAIGGLSPLNEVTDAQVDGITTALNELDPGTYLVAFGSKYEAPFIEDAAVTLREAGCTTVVCVALAPHSASMSTGQYMSRAIAALGEGVEASIIESWWEEPGFLNLVAGRVREALAQIPTERHATTRVIFSAHSLPEKILALGDNYPDQLLESARLVAELADVPSWMIAWQSAGRTADPWIGPDILEVLHTLPAEGITDIVSCPIGFVADHLEVLVDIDVEALTTATECGMNLVRTRSLNADPELCRVLAHRVATTAS